MSGSDEDPGPDLTQGVPVSSLPEDGVLGGHVGEDPVLVARLDGVIVAIDGACSHYSGPLAKGLRVGDTIRCPWHHACFNLRTGAALEAPALSALDRWRVVERDGQVFVREKAPQSPAGAVDATGHPEKIVIVGGGAAGFAAAQRLRELGFQGALTMLSEDEAPPCDRPNLSKDYLAGEADPDWIPLKDDDFYREQDIDLRLGARVRSLAVGARKVELESGKSLDYDALLLATGAEPKRPETPGFDRQNAHVLRSLADSDALIAAAGEARTVSILGASFIGLEAAAALSQRGLEVHVIAPGALPLASKLGPELGAFIRDLHEGHGVRFHLGRKAESFDGGRLTLDDGSSTPADVLLLGLGVKPRLGLAKAAGLDVGKGVKVDRRFETSAKGVFAAGDIAFYPGGDGAYIRVEHWVAAQRQGQIAAANMLGADAPIAEPPFFWSAHYDVSLRYVGHAETWDRIEIAGSIAEQDATLRFVKDGKVLAIVTLGRDMDALTAAQAMRESS